MARKGVARTVIRLGCTECQSQYYCSEKNKRNLPDRLELRKYCRRCRVVRLFREKR